MKDYREATAGTYKDGIRDREMRVMSGEISDIRNEIRQIKDSLINLEVGSTKIKTDVFWIKKNYFIITTAIVGGIVVMIFNAINGT